LLRRLVEQNTGLLSDIEFAAVMSIATAEIKCNRIAWMQRTSLKELIKIASQSVKALRRCN